MSESGRGGRLPRPCSVLAQWLLHSRHAAAAARVREAGKFVLCRRGSEVTKMAAASGPMTYECHSHMRVSIKGCSLIVNQISFMVIFYASQCEVVR